ncbi:ModD protein [Azorhizobium doebereinerae]|uniref:ModD protein n=1 Tax=Azorhizobium doebereinerae TaxID=281091 RepID=UPI000413E271|nr:ModD protein [Azorhizobium doebereinerae]
MMREWSPERIEALLAEDVPHGDLTTHLLGIGAQPGRMRFQMRRPGVVCGIEAAAQLVRAAGGVAQVRAATGTRVDAGDLLLEASGPAGALHQAWKVAQTLVEYLSGIATATAAIVDAARAVAPDVAVVTTRKTFPGNKAAMIAAIRAGGAEPHRLGLSETLLVFPEHRAFLADPAAAIARLRRLAPEKRVVVEVDTVEGARAILPAGPDILQCEKMTPADIAAVVAAVAEAGSPALVAAAGGVNAGNAADYARAGAHILVSSAPYWAAPADVKVTLEPA